MTISNEMIVLENFVDEDSCRAIRDYMRTLVRKNDHTPGIYPAMAGFENGIEASKFFDIGIIQDKDDVSTKVDNLLRKIIESTRLIAQKFFDDDIDLFHFCYHTMLPGARQGLHSDSTDLEGNPTGENGEQEPQEYSALIYLSNGVTEYSGGEINFPKQDACFAPSIGDLVIFRGNHEYPHEVKEVTSGMRDTIVLFFCKKENNRNATIVSIIPEKSL